MSTQCLLALGLALVASSCGDSATKASADPIELVLIRIDPADGQSSAPRNRIVRMTLNTTVLPESVTDQSIQVRTGGTFQTRPQGSFLILGNVIEFDPTVTSAGGANALGFPAGAQILVKVAIKEPGDGRPVNDFLQNIEGNPVTTASGDSIVSFSTGCTWDDVAPGPPGVLGLDFTPAPNSVGQVPPNAAVTVVFSEPIDPESVLLGVNIFLTQNTATAPNFQQDIPSLVFFDGTLTRYTFQPVFGYGQGPFEILVNFIDPDDPTSFNPASTPRDLAGNPIQNFTFRAPFNTQFDPNVQSVGIIREDFSSRMWEDALLTDANWATDVELPFALIGAPIATRIQNVDINRILDPTMGMNPAIGGATDLPDLGGPVNEGRICAPQTPLIGPEAGAMLGLGFPPTSAGRRLQNTYRRYELGPSGTIIRMAWAPLFDSTTAATYPEVIIRMGHKRADTNLTEAGFNSEFDLDGFVTVADAAYSVAQQADVNGGLPNDGYVDWPEFQNFFGYNGEDDLLVDIQATEGTVSQFFRVFHAVSQVTGGPACTCPVLFNQQGGCETNNTIGHRVKEGTFGSDVINPTGINLGLPNPSPTAYVMQFEMTKLESKGVSLYYDSGSPAPDYLDPVIAPVVQPCGASVEMRWSGSMDGIVEDVPFTPNINAIDGYRYIRFQAKLNSNLFTGSRARIELLSIPYRP